VWLGKQVCVKVKKKKKKIRGGSGTQSTNQNPNKKGGGDQKRKTEKAKPEKKIPQRQRASAETILGPAKKEERLDGNDYAGETWGVGGRKVLHTSARAADPLTGKEKKIGPRKKTTLENMSQRKNRESEQL